MSPLRTSSESPLAESGRLLHAGDIRTPLAVDEDGVEEGDHVKEVASWEKRPWWKRPSPYWIVFGAPINGIGFSAAFAPRVEVYTSLACRVHKPQFFPDGPPGSFFLPLDYDSSPSLQTEPATFSPTKTDGDQSPFLFVPYSAPYASGSRFEEDPNTRKKCTTDPDVQAAVASLLATLVTTTGILSCLVTGWWGMFCDRHGRRPVLAVSVLGLLLTELTFIITANFFDYLPGGYWFLLVGYVMEGFLGSLSTEITASHAYMADTSELSSRTRIFALELGLKFAGFAVGPFIGGIIIHLTGSTLSVFFLAVFLHSICALLIVFVLPESLTDAKARIARLRYKAEKDEKVNDPVLLCVLKEATRFLSALSVLLPRDTIGGTAHRQSRRDWNLFFLTMCYGLNTSFHASLPFLFQYAIGIFSWSPETTNYYFALIGVSHALVLTIILPFLIKFLKPTNTTHTPPTTHEPCEGTRFHPSPSSFDSSSTHQPTSVISASSQSAKVDLTLARCALIIEVVSCLIMATTTSGTLFTIGTMIASASIAFPPIAQSLALEIYRRKTTREVGDEAGKLFGAMSVVQTLGMQVIGPSVLGYVYAHSVPTFPQAIILVTALCFALSFVLLAFVRVPSSPMDATSDEDAESSEGNDEATRA